MFLPIPGGVADLDTQSLFREPIHVALPVDHRLAAETAISQNMRTGETILALEPEHKLRDQVHAIREDVGDICRILKGTAPEITLLG